jgi:acetylornithine deacetylase
VTEKRCNVRMVYGSPRFTLTSHLDTLPGWIPVTIDDEYISGLGACSAKGQIISQLWGLSRAVEAGLEDFCCQYVVGQEIDGIGARTLIRNNPTTEYLINGEPTGNRFVRKCWGSLTLDLVVKQSSSDTAGAKTRSAVHQLIADLQPLTQLASDDLRINVGLISGGSTANSTAERATAAIAISYGDSFERCLALISDAVTHAQIEIKALCEPTNLFVPRRYEGSSVDLECGSACSIYTKHFPHVMLYGPGSGGKASAVSETLSRSELDQAAWEICDLCLELAGHADLYPMLARRSA